MTNARLHGITVLVTRPQAQAIELIEAIRSAGGRAIGFPVIEIVPRNERAVSNDTARLPNADIVIYVSQNAVQYGIQYAGKALIGVMGPTTAAAAVAAGYSVDIAADSGYDSESLLMQPALKDVAGKQIRIVRGGKGRELLADTLQQRGASVSYLSVYERIRPAINPELLTKVEAAWRDNGIDAVTVMSVETLENLVSSLPEHCAQRLTHARLVTPAARVIKEVLDRYPGSKPILASGPQTADMLEAIISIPRTEPGHAI